MNAVDHPMGGTGGGRGIPSTSPWGKITKGKFTVKKHLHPLIIRARPTTNRRKKQPIRRGMCAVNEQDILALESSFAETTLNSTPKQMDEPSKPASASSSA